MISQVEVSQNFISRTSQPSFDLRRQQQPRGVLTFGFDPAQCAWTETHGVPRDYGRQGRARREASSCFTGEGFIVGLCIIIFINNSPRSFEGELKDFERYEISAIRSDGQLSGQPDPMVMFPHK